ncbi:hypothetical protein [Deinococcus kurensis]|uniref:hypothetical protein n=1 Tax=Deinococcus kurensis TaxID=2662757 RepID=UPI0012D2EC61|nr:hypothetical protein [Deinococcus kurensis]
MTDTITPTERAIRAERDKQRAYGYTPANDLDHPPGTLAVAAAISALAANPARGTGPTPRWPFWRGGPKASFRLNLERAAAFIWAELERGDADAAHLNLYTDAHGHHVIATSAQDAARLYPDGAAIQEVPRDTWTAAQNAKVWDTAAARIPTPRTLL